MALEAPSEWQDVAAFPSPSTELKSSDAPLLLSARAQRTLGLNIDLGDHEDCVSIHSKTLGGPMEVINRGGLPGLRLLPGEAHEKNMVLHTSENEGDDDTTSPSSWTSTSPTSTASSPKHYIEEEDTLNNLDLTECSVKVMTKNQRKMVEKAVEVIEKEDMAMWTSLKTPAPGHRKHAPLPCKTFLKEIFAGAATLTLMALAWGLTVGEPIDIPHNPDHDVLKHDNRVRISQHRSTRRTPSS